MSCCSVSSTAAHTDAFAKSQESHSQLTASTNLRFPFPKIISSKAKKKKGKCDWNHEQ